MVASPFTVRWQTGLAAIDKAQWDRLAQPLATPLLEWMWLHALEASGSIAPPNGWYPRHLTVWSGPRLVAAAPLYIKTHSAGEFVFDHFWAQLADRLAQPYYPKLVGMIPATPAVGYRFLLDPDIAPGDLLPTMLGAIDRLCADFRLNACQFNFVDPSWIATFENYGYAAWQHQNFTWHNPGLTDFTEYLARFNTSQRRNIRRERRRMHSAGITLRALSGNQIDPRLAGTMWRFYLRTNAQYGPWAARFLNRDFFERIFRDYRHRLLLMAAFADGAAAPQALALLLHKEAQLIGRYWGCAAPVKDLHFNLCYYAPIEWAIAHDIRLFDPGAGSPHKILRGFSATRCASLHRFQQPSLDGLFRRLLPEINAATEAYIVELNQHRPFARRDFQASGSMEN